MGALQPNPSADGFWAAKRARASVVALSTTLAVRTVVEDIIVVEVTNRLALALHRRVVAPIVGPN